MKSLLWLIILFSFQRASLLLAQPNQDSLLIAEYLSHYQNDSDTAWLQKAMDIARSVNYNEGMANVYIEHAKRCMAAEDYQKSLNYLLDAKRLVKNSSDSLVLERLNTNLSQIYYYTTDSERAIYHGEKALEIARKRKKRFNESVHLGNLAAYYLMAGNVEKTMECQKACLAIGYELDDPHTIMVSLNSIGTLHFQQENYQEALTHYELALEYAIEMQEDSEICRIHTNLAETCILLQLPQKALRFISLSNHYCKEQLINMQAYRARVVAKAQQMVGNYKEATEYFELHIALSDSVLNQEKIKAVNELTAKYETELKEQQIQMLETSQQLQQARFSRLVALSGLTLLILIMIGIIAWQIHRQRRKSDFLLSNILPKSAILELKKYGQVKARQYNNVSILFTDFVNFTAFAEKLSPDQLVAQIDICYRQFDQIIGRNQCEKIKTIGDAYMAVCGLPNADPDHALHLSKAALEIRDFMHYYNKHIRHADLPELRIRIGLHSGKVIAGVVGSNKFAYDIWGDSVNVAARMEQFGTPDFVNISAQTQRLLPSNAQTTYRGEIEVKGKGLIPMYYLEKL